MSRLSKKIKKFFKGIGPGVITGASDDDPAGIGIYSQAGAQVGYNLLWAAPFLFPFMVAIQRISARIGMVTGLGLVGAMKKHYPPVLLWVIAGSVFVANTVNIGADLLAMAAVTRLLIPVNLQIIAFAYGAVILSILLLFSYKGLARVLKWLTLSLFAYIFAIFVSNPDWGAIAKSTLIPHLSFTREYLLLFVAILGTTISPYLFFWQASEEAEDRVAAGLFDARRNIQRVTKRQLNIMRLDITLGMFFSNTVMFFIIATTASTLFAAGIHQVNTAQEAASALRPLAGDASFLLFTLGIVGTGFLAIPILAGSAAYAISELFGFREGFGKPFFKSKTFYGVIILSTVIGVAFTLFEIPPFRALFLTGVLYGVLAPFLILIILDIANRKAIMGKHVNGLFSNIMGVAIFVLMSLAAVGALIL